MDRRPLTAGIGHVPNADPEAVRRFITPESPADRSSPKESSLAIRSMSHESKGESDARRRRSKSTGVVPVGLIPVTVRLTPEIAGALKRASLERQLAGDAIFTQQELVEEALEPWLRSHGYLR
jgi:hypothetical protein